MAYTREEFIKKIAPIVKMDMKITGILASVTLAQAALESGNGNTTLASIHNNLFGMKGSYNGQSVVLPTMEYVNGSSVTVSAQFRVYPSWRESIRDHSALLCNDNYNLSGVTDYRAACDKLQNAKYKYATDPTYAATLKSLISQHNLTKYDIGQNVNSPAGSILTQGSGSTKKEGNTVDYAQRIAAIALKEQKDENIGGQKFWSWWGHSSRVAWCAIFVSWCANQAGIPTSIIPKEEGCARILDFASRNGRYFQKGTYVPKMGDIFLFGGDHTGIVVSSDGTTFKTIEGNSSNMVAQREYSLGEARLTGFFSPNYPAVTGSPGSEEASGQTYGNQVLKYLNDIAGKKQDKAKTKVRKLKNVALKQSGFNSCQLVIFHGKYKYTPTLKDGVTWSLERSGVPGQLSFSVIPDKVLKMEEGDSVQFRWNGNRVFFGFIFEKKETQDHAISVTCYDQLRYLKNKDTYVYEKKRADQIIKMIADDFGMQVGSLAKTSYVIASKIEDDKTLFDIIDNALSDTLLAETKMYVLYDDFGKLTLREISDMKVDIIIDAETAQSYSYTSSINDNTYNKVKLDYANDNTETRDIYIAKDSGNIKKWGVLQYYEKETSNVTIEDGETTTKMITTNLKEKADALLNLYNDAAKRLQIKKCFGNVNVRAGSSVIVNLKLHDMKLSKYMMVEKVTHNFEDTTHTMDLTLIGGAFVA